MSVNVKDLSRQEYELIRRLVYARSGINLGSQKMQLVRARLGKLVRSGRFKSFREYFNHVERDPTGEELCRLLDAISTNTTHLFRENRHFQLLRKIIENWIRDKHWRAKNKSLRMWSAGCSSGEEPYSMAMTADAVLRSLCDVDLKILATDLSVRMLSLAKLGLFEVHRAKTVPPEYARRYLVEVEHEGQRELQIIPELRRAVTFARFNLMDPVFPFRRGFHIIFCRNVMIYFDRPTQQSLVAKFTAQLIDGGYLMVGHSESLNGTKHSLSYVEPTVYRKA